MSLTTGSGPLAPRSPAPTNYDIDGPRHLLFLDDFPRRVRAVYAGLTVLDTERGRLLHEGGMLPVLYVPQEDLAQAMLRPSDHRTHCPFKGEAVYWSVEAGGRTAENAVWAYPDPIGDAAWLSGYAAVYFDAMDAWYDEDEEVHGHLRDPYHRVDARAASRPVRVRTGPLLLAESSAAVVLSETGLPNHWYLPREDVRADLRPSDTTSVCPYKGTASYWSVDGLGDVAWSYERPLEDAAKVAGHVCFDDSAVTVEVG